MSTDKDKPQSRGLPARQNDDAVREAFTKMVDNDTHLTGLPAQTAAANQKRALALLKSVRAKR